MLVVSCRGMIRVMIRVILERQVVFQQQGGNTSLGAGASSESVLSEESSLVSRCLSLILGTTLGRFTDMYRIVAYSVCSLQQWRLCIFGIGNVFPLMFCVLLCVCEFFDYWIVILFDLGIMCCTVMDFGQSSCCCRWGVKFFGLRVVMFCVKLRRLVEMNVFVVFLSLCFIRNYLGVSLMGLVFIVLYSTGGGV